MASIHLTLQGKGGVGKSFLSTVVAQYLKSKGFDLNCIDTDPVNNTFAGYKALDVDVLELGDTADEINPRRFDDLMERIFNASPETQIVIDNGAATFLPMINYMRENDALALLQENDHKIIIHTVLTGGQAFKDTLDGLAKLFEYFPDVSTVVWLNEFFGPVEHAGKDFEGSQVYERNKDRIHAIVKVGKLRKETYGADLEEVMKSHMTFEEALADPEMNIMTRQRLKTVWNTFSTSLDMAMICPPTPEPDEKVTPIKKGKSNGAA